MGRGEGEEGDESLLSLLVCNQYISLFTHFKLNSIAKHREQALSEWTGCRLYWEAFMAFWFITSLYEQEDYFFLF